MDKATGLEGFEAYGLEVDVPGSLRNLADQIESGEIKVFAIITLDESDGPESLVACRNELVSDFMQTVVEELNSYLCESSISVYKTTH